MNILGSLERFLDRRNAFNFALVYLLISFFLFVVARWVGLDSSEFVSGLFKKRIGLYGSVNWTITFIILYPIFIFIATSAASNNLVLWQDAAANSLVTGVDGIVKSGAALQSEWSDWLKRSNLITVAFAAISAVIAFSDYYDSASGPLTYCTIAFTDASSRFLAPIDWATAPIVNGQCADHRISLLSVSFLLYVLLIFSLIFFLVFLYYSVSVFNFLKQISKRVPNGNRLIYRPGLLQTTLTPAIECLMLSVILGLSVCALMQAHAAYLRAVDPDVVAFLTSDMARIAENVKLGWLFPKSAIDPGVRTAASGFMEYQAGVTPKGLTVLPLVATVLLSGVVSTLLLFDSLRNSLVYCKERAADADWRNRVGITAADVAVLNVETPISALLKIVSPYGVVYVVGSLFLLVSIITANFFVFLASIVLIAVFRLAIKLFL